MGNARNGGRNCSAWRGSNWFNGNITLTNGYITVLNIGSIFADLQITGNLEVGGNLDLTGNIKGGGNLEVTGDINANNLELTGDIEVGGNIEDDAGTIIFGIASINVSPIINSTIHSANINISQYLDLHGILTATTTTPFTHGSNQTLIVGTFSLKN